MFFICDPYYDNLLNTRVLQYGTLNLESTQLVAPFLDNVLGEAAQMLKHPSFHSMIVNFIKNSAISSLEPSIMRESIICRLRFVNVTMEHRSGFDIELSLLLRGQM